LATATLVGDEYGPGVRPKRARGVSLYTAPPAEATIVCVDELGPVIPRTFAPAPGWTPDGHRVKAPREYSRGTEKTWGYGALRVRDGQAITFTSSRNTAGHLDLLERVATANPEGAVSGIGDTLASHKSPPVQAWLAAHPRVQQVLIPKGASWLNLQEPWWRLLRREAYAGQTFADAEEITHATATATTQLNAHAQPWLWGRPAPSPRRYRRRFVYCL
jgi:hypothetical protein